MSRGGDDAEFRRIHRRNTGAREAQVVGGIRRVDGEVAEGGHAVRIRRHGRASGGERVAVQCHVDLKTRDIVAVSVSNFDCGSSRETLEGFAGGGGHRFGNDVDAVSRRRHDRQGAFDLRDVVVFGLGTIGHHAQVIGVSSGCRRVRQDNRCVNDRRAGDIRFAVRGNQPCHADRRRRIQIGHRLAGFDGRSTSFDGEIFLGDIGRCCGSAHGIQRVVARCGPGQS